MIARIMGVGQFEVANEHLEELNRLDDELVETVDSNDAEGFKTALEALLASVRTVGTELPSDFLGPSDLILPGPDSTIEEVSAILSEDGLIPG